MQRSMLKAITRERERERGKKSWLSVHFAPLGSIVNLNYRRTPSSLSFFPSRYFIPIRGLVSVYLRTKSVRALFFLSIISLSEKHRFAAVLFSTEWLLFRRNFDSRWRLSEGRSKEETRALYDRNDVQHDDIQMRRGQWHIAAEVILTRYARKRISPMPVRSFAQLRGGTDSSVDTMIRAARVCFSTARDECVYAYIVGTRASLSTLRSLAPFSREKENSPSWQYWTTSRGYNAVLRRRFDYIVRDNYASKSARIKGEKLFFCIGYPCSRRRDRRETTYHRRRSRGNLPTITWIIQTRRAPTPPSPVSTA